MVRSGRAGPAPTQQRSPHGDLPPEADVSATRPLPRTYRAAVATTLLLALGTTAAPGLAATTPAPATAPGYAALGTWKLLALVNDHRRSLGLRSLTVDPALARQARTWTEHMAASGDLAHHEQMFSGSVRSSLRMGAMGENVGWNRSVAAQHVALLNSPGHRHNIEDPRFTRAGFAVVRAADGRLWTTEDFGVPRP